MATLRSDLEAHPRTWTRGAYTISTSIDQIPLEALNAMLESKDMYWSLALPEAVLLETLKNSICVGMYHQPEDKEEVEFMGFGRCITDFVTFVYLTDVYVRPQHQKGGLGRWMVKCIQEIVDLMPHLRRTVLLTGDWERSVPFYESILSMEVMDGRKNPDGKGGVGLAVLTRKGPGAAF